MVLPDSHEFLVDRRAQEREERPDLFAYWAITFSGAFQTCSAKTCLVTLWFPPGEPLSSLYPKGNTRVITLLGLGCSHRSPLLGNRISFFSSGTRWFSSQLASLRDTGGLLQWAPHSESRIVPLTTKLIAVYALHRLLAPRHPPYALSNLIQTFNSLTNLYLQEYLLFPPCYFSCRIIKQKLL